MEDVEIMGTTLENYAKAEEIAQQFVPNPSLEHRATYEEVRAALIEMANWKDKSYKKEQQNKCLDYGKYELPKDSFVYKNYEGLCVIKPKYQVGDVLVKEGNLEVITSIDPNHTHYNLMNQFGDTLYIPFKNLEEEYVLATNVDNKFLGSRTCRMCPKYKFGGEPCQVCVGAINRLTPEQKQQLDLFIEQLKNNKK